MLRFLRSYVFSNAGLKLLALAVSFLLWSTYTAEPPAEVGFQVPLEFTNMPAQLEMTGDVPTVVHVRVRGRSTLLRRMVPADMNIRIDLHDGKAGDTPLNITPQSVGIPFGATVVGLSPSEFHVTLVPRRGPPLPAQ
jgi:hypothetical protein